MEIKFTYKMTNPQKRLAELKIGEWFLLKDRGSEGHSVHILVCNDEGEAIGYNEVMDVFAKKIVSMPKKLEVQPAKEVSLHVTI